MNWIKKHLESIISLACLLVIVVFFWNWTSSSSGKTIITNLLSNLPFLSFIYKIYGIINKVNISNAVSPLPEKSSVILDMLKLLIATPISALIMSLINKVIYNKADGTVRKQLAAEVEDYDHRNTMAWYSHNEWRNLSASEESELIEGNRLRNHPTASQQSSMAADILDSTLKSANFRIMFAIINAVTTIFTLLMASKFVESKKQYLLSFLSTKTGSLIGIIVLVLCFFLYCFIFNMIYKRKYSFKNEGSYSFSIIKVIVFNIIPSTVFVYITGALYYFSHLYLVTERYSLRYCICIAVLIVWCGIQNFLNKEIQTTAVAYRNYYNFQFVTFIAALCIYASYLIAAQFYSNDIDLLMQNKFVQMFCNINALPFYEYIINGIKVIDKINLSDSGFQLELVKLCYFALTVCLISKLLKNIKAELSIRGFIMWSIKLSIEIALVFGLYSFLLYITKGDLNKMMIYLAIYTILAVIINIISANRNSTSNLSFAPTNILIESLLIIAGAMFLIYVAESIADENFLYLSVTYNPNGTIDDIFTNGFIIRMIIISVASIVWYVLDVLDLGIKNNSV